MFKPTHNGSTETPAVPSYERLLIVVGSAENKISNKAESIGGPSVAVLPEPHAHTESPFAGGETRYSIHYDLLFMAFAPPTYGEGLKTLFELPGSSSHVFAIHGKDIYRIYKSPQQQMGHFISISPFVKSERLVAALKTIFKIDDLSFEAHQRVKCLKTKLCLEEIISLLCASVERRSSEHICAELLKTELLMGKGVFKQKNYREAFLIFDHASLAAGYFKRRQAPFGEIITETEILLSEALYSRGVARCFLGNFAEAINDFDTVIKLTNQLQAPAYQVTEAFQKKDDQYRAAYWASRANFGAAYYFRGQVLCHLGEYSRAISDFSEAIQRGVGTNHSDILMEPRTPPFYVRGLAKFELGDYRGAIEDYQKALAIRKERNMEEALNVLQSLEQAQLKLTDQESRVGSIIQIEKMEQLENQLSFFSP